MKSHPPIQGEIDPSVTKGGVQESDPPHIRECFSIPRLISHRVQVSCGRRRVGGYLRLILPRPLSTTGYIKQVQAAPDNGELVIRHWIMNWQMIQGRLIAGSTICRLKDRSLG